MGGESIYRCLIPELLVLAGTILRICGRAGGPGESYHVWCQWRNQKELLGDFKWYDLVPLKFISFCRRKFIFLKQIKSLF